MALINKIRQRAGLAVGVVAVAMGLFIVGTDLFNSNSTLLGKNDTTIGEIAGEEIDYEEFQQELDQMVYNFSLRNNRNPSDNEMNTLRQQAWELLIVKNAFQDQYDELGINVTEEENWDMIQGNNIDFNIRQSFTNPETGEFDRSNVVAYLRDIGNRPDNDPQKLAWKLFEESLKPGRLRMKYDNLLAQTTYATDAEAELAYKNETSVAEISYLFVSFADVDDSAVEINDQDLQTYYNNHKDEYESDASASISYASIPINPSKSDTLYFKEEMERIKEEFKNVNNDSLYAKSNSDTRNFFSSYSVDQLPDKLQANYSNLSEGDVRGPYYVNGFLTLYKIAEISSDTVESVEARHILIKWDDESDESKAAARREAQSLLNQLRGGADFAELARENSEDPGSAVRGGDLGWFGRNRMVKPFEDAAFAKTSAGLVNEVVESQFGYHIIEVTEPVTNKSFTVATIAREITASEETVNEAYLKAEILASSSDNYDDFIANAAEDSLEISNAENIGKNDRRITGLGNARTVIQWIYKDASVGDISSVFELEDNFVVAVLTSKTEDGIAPFEEVKAQVELKVRNEKEAEYVKGKLNELTGTLEEMAENYGPEANLLNSSDLKLSTNTLPTVGFAPEVVGTAFGMTDGEVSEPIVTENGVVVVRLDALTPAPEIADYSSYKSQIEQRNTSRVSFNISEAIREEADIKDYRYKFF